MKFKIDYKVGDYFSGVLLETFKGPISRIFPEINFLLNSLYEIIKDVTLFFKDLIN